MKPDEFKKIRVENKLTQSGMAKKMGVDQSQVSRWERGLQSVPEWVVKLVECLFKKEAK